MKRIWGHYLIPWRLYEEKLSEIRLLRDTDRAQRLELEALQRTVASRQREVDSLTAENKCLLEIEARFNRMAYGEDAVGARADV